MEYLIGPAIGLATAIFVTLAGLERGRVLYPVILIVIASYYELFALMGAPEALVGELVVSAVFLAAAVIGFRTNLWIVVGALFAHGVSDLFHQDLVANHGVPAWWPGFCLSIDATFAAWLGWRLRTGVIEAKPRPSFGVTIKPQVDAELEAAVAAERDGDPDAGFRHLERAHVLGQASTNQHVRVHVQMLRWAMRRRNGREMAGQVLRIVGAATKTALGLVPHGNTGGANVSPLRRMPVPPDLADKIRAAKGAATVVLAAVLLSATLGLGACTSSPTGDVRYADADGHRVAYRVLGSGEPAIVMLAGLGAGMDTFSDVATRLAHVTTVIVYDRAGYGESGRGSGIRDAAATERELDALLAQSGVPGPYVLVGHSLGGLFAEYYAARRPSQIAGLVLEESRPGDFSARCVAAGVSMCAPGPLMMELSPIGAQQEAAVLTKTEADVISINPTDAPVLILSRRERMSPSAFERTWNGSQALLAARYPNAIHLRAPSSGHALHQDAPEWYVAVVAQFLADCPPRFFPPP